MEDVDRAPNFRERPRRLDLRLYAASRHGQVMCDLLARGRLRLRGGVRCEQVEELLPIRVELLAYLRLRDVVSRIPG